ncbi:ABC transporter ATP-binding protein [Sanguibacter antarcticus]|uniref:Energy-coupling factor transport system ATP-binding protein n=1 Tax=Sanguibacter antarcticus TaxID=372484 RepID=A0A2A9E1W3_9MICO|nr:ATP-binding cassette domain-containing protein [Sanguibacter antarcticus]PFG32938.1 energy-coupling factor transport system ATP-binding protein [Sanguibacter antarcticus]
MIELRSFGFSYDGSPPLFAGVDLVVGAGELALVVGPTGTGKSTLLQSMNGLVPRFTGGRVTGEVFVDGRSTREVEPRDLAGAVGYVGQNPTLGFVTAHVESELAFGMEQQGVDPRTMRRRVEETLDLVGIAGLRHRRLETLSLGEQQRVAIGAVLTGAPRALLLDEPTSALDPVGAEEVLATIGRLVHDLGLTVVLAEHRLERVVQLADTVVLLIGDGGVRTGPPQEILPGTTVAPPIVRLAVAAGWDPVPLTVRDARRRARDVVPTLAAPPHAAPRTARSGEHVLVARQVSVRYEADRAVDRVDLTLDAGEITALMGRNGSGKSSLLWTLQGTGRRDGGTVDVQGLDPHGLPPARARALVGLVPQDVSAMLYLETVAEECTASDTDAHRAPGTTQSILDSIVSGGDLPPAVHPGTHPRDLSEGQRLALVLAIVLATEPPVLLLDEPTRGLDHDAKSRLVTALRAIADRGAAVLVATHDVELAADLADRVVLITQGEIVADGDARPMLTGSPSFAPQIAKILSPGPWMRMDDVVFTDRS